MSKCAYLVYISTEDYLPGLLVLHKSMKDVESKYPLVVLTTPALTQNAREVIVRRGLEIITVDPLYPKAQGLHTPVLADKRFAETWTKLRVFELTAYDRLVVLDADMLMRRNMDELMDVELPSTNHIAAVHVCACNPRRIPSYPADWIPANCPHTSTSHPEALTSPPRIEETSPRTYALLNGGLIVLNPSLEVFEGLRRFLEESPEVQKFSFADQDLLATYFRGRWQPLPWCYNAAKTHRTIHPDVWRDDEVRCLHYVLADKPWKARPDAGDPEFKVVNQWWWDELEGLRAEMREVDTEGCKLVEENVAAGSEAEGSETCVD